MGAENGAPPSQKVSEVITTFRPTKVSNVKLSRTSGSVG